MFGQSVNGGVGGCCVQRCSSVCSLFADLVSGCEQHSILRLSGEVKVACGRTLLAHADTVVERIRPVTQSVRE